MTVQQPARPEGRIIKVVTDVAAKMSVLAIILMTGLVALNTLVRALPFVKSLNFVEEYTGYLVVTTVFLGLAHTFRQDGHVRMVLVISRMPPRFRAAWEAIITLAAIFIISILFWHGLNFFLTALETGERAQTVTMTPVWIPRMMVAPGYVVLMLQLLVNLVWKIKEFNALSH